MTSSARAPGDGEVGAPTVTEVSPQPSVEAIAQEVTREAVTTIAAKIDRKQQQATKSRPTNAAKVKKFKFQTVLLIAIKK